MSTDLQFLEEWIPERMDPERFSSWKTSPNSVTLKTLCCRHVVPALWHHGADYTRQLCAERR